MENDELIWQVRAFVYGWFVENAGAPGVEAIAGRFGISPQEAGEALTRLHAAHALFLEPGTTQIRMASPFSAIPTPYLTTIAGLTYWANCAWDSLGIAAALHAPQAVIDSICTASGEPIRLAVERGRVKDTGVVVHFLVPFQHWYDDLVET